jgi:hypothetical protein
MPLSLEPLVVGGYFRTVALAEQVIPPAAKVIVQQVHDRPRWIRPAVRTVVAQLRQKFGNAVQVAIRVLGHEAAGLYHDDAVRRVIWHP